ncbi:rubredoxin [Pontibacter sp. E15-1]|uniref:rubredoxin domain-containing protein n=1 Tax=Pontibacter sp. E15-1 TaxID=2919918 RepID=UPI001F4F7331|nr:rubredoxin domain-containing protein [Pontibacter sp. E15-1]MCJ8166579.1 rubredoxin [Pontibacter sp. E15-1]
MTLKQNLVKINLPGGMVSAGDMYAILEAAEKAGVAHVRFGNRQQVMFYVEQTRLEVLQQDLLAADIMFELDADIHPNIISSYATEDILYHADWLREGVYKDILDLFDYRPQLKISLVDNNQTFFPFFTGNLNFIASDTSNYWYLYIRFPKTNILYAWPSLVYSEDIPRLSSTIESIVFGNREQFYDQPAIEGNVLHGMVTASGNFVVQPVTKALKLPDFKLPYYEGFNRYDSKLWLGIYRRDELFPVTFLKDVCKICLKTRVGQLYTTPWKSIIIKGIELTDRDFWEVALCKHRVNVRHASNELNWQVEDLCDYGLELKKHLVRKFNEEDVRTYRLCFAIKTQPKTGLFGSIIIRAQQKEVPCPDLSSECFEILYTREFNPNSKDFISFRNNVSRAELSPALVELCNYYYELQSTPERMAGMVYQEEEHGTGAEEQAAHIVYQCSHCYTLYDEVYGDALNEVAPGTPFDSIPVYSCPTCEAPKADFARVEMAPVENA